MAKILKEFCRKVRSTDMEARNMPSGEIFSCCREKVDHPVEKIKSKGF